MNNASKNMRSYIKGEVAGFLYTADTFGMFSNMNPNFPLRVAGHDVPATENYYQAMRFPHLPDFQKQILEQDKPIAAKRLAYTRIAEARTDWLQVNIAVMRHALRVRYGHFAAEMADAFRMTGDRPIVEISKRDAFWGAKPEGDLLVGQNILGRLWMELRLEVALHDPSETYVVEAPKGPGMMLCENKIETLAMNPVSRRQETMDL